MFNIVSYLLGLMHGEKHVVIEGGEDYTFSDPNSDGNIVVTKEE